MIVMLKFGKQTGIKGMWERKVLEISFHTAGTRVSKIFLCLHEADLISQIHGLGGCWLAWVQFENLVPLMPIVEGPFTLKCSGVVSQNKNREPVERVVGAG